MGAKRQFFTMDGEVVGEQAAAGARVRYMPDALGSVTMSNDGTHDNSATYTPFGRGSAPSGSTYGWLGASPGYRPTGKTYSSHSAIGRHFTNLSGRWTTLTQPLDLNAYQYANGNPVGRVYDDVDPCPLSAEVYWDVQWHNGTCGAPWWKIYWKLPKDDRCRTGIIVQKMTGTFRPRNCNTGDILTSYCNDPQGNQIPTPNDWSYVEVWGVYQGAPLSDPLDIGSKKGWDIFSWAGFQQGCACGTLTWNAQVKFYPVQNLGIPGKPSYDQVKTYIKNYFTKSQNCDPPGSLYWIDLTRGSYTFPGTPPIAPTESHQLTFKFNCCKGMSRYWYHADLSLGDKKTSYDVGGTDPGCPCPGC